jgi:hypothetical protein
MNIDAWLHRISEGESYAPYALAGMFFLIIVFMLVWFVKSLVDLSHHEEEDDDTHQ